MPKSLPPFFSASFSRGAKKMRGAYRHELRVRPQHRTSGGIEPPEESSNGLRYRELPATYVLSVEERGAGGSLITNRTASLCDFWLNRTEQDARDKHRSRPGYYRSPSLPRQERGFVAAAILDALDLRTIERFLMRTLKHGATSRSAMHPPWRSRRARLAAQAHADAMCRMGPSS